MRARDIRLREERVARLLDDPEKLRELRQQRAERKAEKQQQSKGPLLEHAKSSLAWSPAIPSKDRKALKG